LNAVIQAESPATAVALVDVIGRAAADPNVDIEKMERLLAMHERIVERDAKAQYADALSRLQPSLPLISERGGIKDKHGNVQSRYALWEDIVRIVTPLLAAEGFSLSFRTKSDEKSVTVTGVLLHRAGHSEETSLTLPMDTSGSKNNVQGVGSSTSYGKRYTAAALLNLRTGEVDDDGQSGGSSLPPPPVGTAEQFLSWQADIEALADEGSERLRSVWRELDKPRREYITKHHAEWWDQLKARAMKVPA
jgi:hypothetical protein